MAAPKKKKPVLKMILGDDVISSENIQMVPSHYHMDITNCNFSVGDYVKINNNKERFWVEITKVHDNNEFTGRIDNVLIRKQPYKFNDIITFNKDRIIEFEI
jgi:hypothetical protein